MSMCRVFSCVFGRGVCYDQCILLAKLYYSLPCFILYSKAKFACYSRCFLTSYFCIPVPYNEKDIFFGKMWSTGEGNGKPVQYSCLESPMNSMKRQNDSQHTHTRRLMHTYIFRECALPVRNAFHHLFWWKRNFASPLELLCLLSSLFLSLFFACHVACGVLVLWPGTEALASAVKAQS